MLHIKTLKITPTFKVGSRTNTNSKGGINLVKLRHVSAYLEAIFRFTKCWLIETNVRTVWLDVEISSSNHTVPTLVSMSQHFVNLKTTYMVTSTYENRRNAGDLRIVNKTFEVVQSFQYLGNITSNINNNNKCIKERIMMGNKAYYANRQLFNSSHHFKKHKVADIPHIGTPSGHLRFRIMDTYHGRGMSISSV
jgi:hypothetical protein